MKKIEAIVRPGVFPQIRQALAQHGIDGFSVSEVAGIGNQEGRTGLFRGNKYEMEFHTKLKLEMVVDDSEVAALTDLIVKYASTGKVGDGKIFVYPVEEAIRIRTKEKGAVAVH
ncbi:P-II family nitrogen regulator [Chryseomicrobium sp. FSL W7-1435]|uniref:P-II family nitrogen regulator n=1 Tax=Chryseomicrobium sp. FSL W7-1435 TaxID=2921704 RepID=UPI00315B0638